MWPLLDDSLKISKRVRRSFFSFPFFSLFPRQLAPFLFHPGRCSPSRFAACTKNNCECPIARASNPSTQGKHRGPRWMQLRVDRNEERVPFRRNNDYYRAILQLERSGKWHRIEEINRPVNLSSLFVNGKLVVKISKRKKRKHFISNTISRMLVSVKHTSYFEPCFAQLPVEIKG